MVRAMTPMKFCPKCNLEYDDSLVFCTQDRTPLKSDLKAATLRSPGIALRSERGSRLVSSPLRTAALRPAASNAALATSLDLTSDPNPAEGLTRELEITPFQPHAVPPDDDFGSGGEADSYAHFPTLAISAPMTADTAAPAGSKTANSEDSNDGEHEEPDLSGQTIAGRYRVIRQLGEGGMGVVYQAIDERLDKPVALKVLKEDFSKRPDIVARFTQEAKSAARIKHENVLDVTDYGKTESGSYYIAMELLVGSDLADALRKDDPMTVERATDIAVQICRALSAAHGLGVVHRDMKPENVFLLKSTEGREVVKIVDFGIAQMKDAAGENTRKLTRTGMIFGTPEYMSPEQAAGKQIDHRVDVYATGVILYEMFAGRVPFVGDSFMGVLTQHMFEAPPAIAELNPDTGVTPEFSAVIFKALAKDPNQRYASMAEFSEDLIRVRQGSRPSAPLDYFAIGSPTAAPVATAPIPSGSSTEGSARWARSVGAAGTMETERPRKRSPGPAIAIATVLIGGAIAAAFALGSKSNSGNQTRLAVSPVVPIRPLVPPVMRPPVTPPAVNPTIIAPHPVAPAHTLVTMQVITTPTGAQVRGEPIEGNGVTFTCTTPCTEHVPSDVPMRLTAQRSGRRGTMVVTPIEAMAPVQIQLEGTRLRPSPSTPTPSTPHSHSPRCGMPDPDTGLLIPCFNHDSGNAH